MTKLSAWRRVCTLFLLCAATSVAQSNPAPLLYQPLIPASVAPGHSSFMVTLHGTGFVPGAVVMANRQALRTKFVSGSTLEAKVPSQLVEKPRTGFVTVVNPGSIASNVVFFSVRDPSSTVKMRVDPHFTAPSGAVAAGDFNNDGKLDIAVGQETDGPSWTVSVYPGNGDGTFQVPIDTVLTGLFEQTETFFGMTTGDFNGDGLLDIAVFSYSNQVCEQDCDFTTVLLNNGDGTFSAQPNYDYTWVTAFGDLNGDGILDTVEIDNEDGPLGAVLLGNGDGTFRVGTGLALPSNVAAIHLAAFGDFNKDGKLDVAMAGFLDVQTPAIGIFLGNGDGTFGEGTFYPTPYGGFQVLVADLNGDGNLDLVGDDACVLLGQGDGTFVQGGSCSNWFTISPSVLGDFNGDGKLDFASLTRGGTFNIWLGNGDGTFQTPIMFPAQAYEDFFTSGPPLGDFNSDGKLDFVLAGGTPLLGIQVPK